MLTTVWLRTRATQQSVATHRHHAACLAVFCKGTDHAWAVGSYKKLNRFTQLVETGLPAPKISVWASLCYFKRNQGEKVLSYKSSSFL